MRSVPKSVGGWCFGKRRIVGLGNHRDKSVFHYLLFEANTLCNLTQILVGIQDKYLCRIAGRGNLLDKRFFNYQKKISVDGFSVLFCINININNFRRTLQTNSKTKLNTKQFGGATNATIGSSTISAIFFFCSNLIGRKWGRMSNVSTVT